MTCRDFPCDFRVEDTDDYSAYCLECGRRDPMAELVLAGMQVDQEIAETLAEFTVRADDDYEFVDDEGNGFHVRVLGPLMAGDPRRLGLYRKTGDYGWHCVGMFRDFPALVRGAWREATAVRLERLGIAPADLDPPF